MIRFESGARFVELELLDNAIHRQWGARDRPRRSRLQLYADATAARIAWVQQLRRLDHHGYQSGFHDPRFEALLRANPDEVDAYRAYGDWLQEHGDPRGQLIATMIAGQSHEALLREHALALVPSSPTPVQYRWRAGFIEHAEYVAPKWATVRRLFRHSSALTLRSVSVHQFELGWGEHVGDWNALAPLVPPTLSRIEVAESSMLWVRRVRLAPPLARLLVSVT